jgi:hypothetical protein
MLRLDLFNKPIDPGFHLLGRLTPWMFFRRWATVGPNPPIRLDLFDLVRAQSLVCAVIPLDNVLGGLERDIDRGFLVVFEELRGENSRVRWVDGVETSVQPQRLTNSAVFCAL